MIDNSALKTRIKLLTFFLIVSIIPLILLGVASSVIMKKYEKELSLSSVSNMCSMTSEHLSGFMKIIESKVDYAAANPYVRESVGNTDAGNASVINAVSYLDGIAESDPCVLGIIIADTNGAISASSVDFASLDIQGIDPTSMEDDIKYCSGFSDLAEFSVHDGAIHVFSCSKYIKNSTGETIGSITFVMDTSRFLSQAIPNNKDSLDQTIVSDWNGNLFISEKTGVRNYSELKEFGDKKDMLDSISGGTLSKQYEYEFDDYEKVVQYANISNTKNTSNKYWSVISITSVKGAVSRYKDLSSSIQSTIFAISIIDIILIVLFSIMFLRPITNAMRILMVNELNVSSQRVLVNGTTELDELNKQINVLLDTLSESEQRYKYIVDMTDNIIFEYSVKKNVFTFSDNYNKKFSYRANSLKYEDSFFVNAKVYRDDVENYKRFVAAATEGQSVQDEFRFKTIYNDYVWYIVRCAAIRDSYNNIIKIVGVMIDIDKTKSREQKLMDKASLDPLTQAFNRESFELSLNNEIDLSQMRKRKDAVLFIDLDNFKHFNDEYNHAVGDEVLVYTVETAKKLVGKNGFVGRFGGDEFVVCYRETDDMDASLLAQRIISVLGDGFESENSGQHIVMCCSIGISYINPEDSDPSDIIERADQAMYSVKKSGKSNYAIYVDK